MKTQKHFSALEIINGPNKNSTIQSCVSTIQTIGKIQIICCNSGLIGSEGLIWQEGVISNEHLYIRG